MNRLAIVADNLIGANDAGAQFTKFGFRSQVLLNHLDLMNHCIGVDIVAINTNSRKVSPDVAYDRVYQVGKHLLKLGFVNVYKKIDSTLRGNIAEEVRAMLDSMSLTLAIIVPSYPAHGRIVEDGYLQIVQDWGDSRVSVPIYYIPSIVSPAADAPVAVLGLPDVHQGEMKLSQQIRDLHTAGVRFIVIDAVTDADLRMIAMAVNQLEVPCLAVGSAGLVGNMPLAWQAAEQEYIGLRQGTMLVAGTLNRVTSEQISSVLEDPRTELVDISSEAIYNGEGIKELERVLGNIGALLIDGKIPVVIVDTLLGDRTDPDALRLSEQVGQYGHLVTQCLSQIAQKAVEQFYLKNLVISGGGTATIICQALGVAVIDLERELLPGIPLGKAVGGFCDGLCLVTKAGGFGKKDALTKVLELL